MGVYQQPWSESDFAMLRELWEKGLSTRQIGVAMGRSRNSIIGSSHRLSLPPRRIGALPGQFKKPKAIRPRRPRKVYLRTHPLATPTKPISEPLGSPGSGVSLMDLTWRHCKFIIGPDEARMGFALYCGNPVLKGKSWCNFHAQICYEPPRERGHYVIRQPK